MPPIQSPFFLEAAILSRMRSPVTSRIELSEGEQHIERQPPHRAGGIELLGRRHERHAVGVEDLDHLGEVGERAGQPVDLVYHHYIDQLVTNVGQQALQCWA